MVTYMLFAAIKKVLDYVSGPKMFQGILVASLAALLPVMLDWLLL